VSKRGHDYKVGKQVGLRATTLYCSNLTASISNRLRICNTTLCLCEKH